MSRLLAIGILIGSLQGCAPQHLIIVQADKVTLLLNAPQAKQVQFASSTDHYTAHDATKDPEGHWVVTELANQEFQYFYLIDGKSFIPDCRFRQHDDFGTTNCRYLP
jgi:hypothetical protein